MMPARILYVDDEDDIREIAQMSLELEPEFEVRSSASGNEALTDAADWRPDLILLDVMMPDMDGPETLKRLAECPRRTGERVGDTDQGRVGIGEGTAFTDGLQFRELIGAPGEETLTQRGEGIVWDGSAP